MGSILTDGALFLCAEDVRQLGRRRSFQLTEGLEEALEQTFEPMYVQKLNLRAYGQCLLRLARDFQTLIAADSSTRRTARYGPRTPTDVTVKAGDRLPLGWALFSQKALL